MLSERACTRSHRTILLGLAAIAVSATTTWSLDAQTLQGSRASMDRQVRMARQHDYTFIDTPERVRYFAEQGWLVRIESVSRSFVTRFDSSWDATRCCLTRRHSLMPTERMWKVMAAFVLSLYHF